MSVDTCLFTLDLTENFLSNLKRTWLIKKGKGKEKTHTGEEGASCLPELAEKSVSLTCGSHGRPP